MKRIDADTRFLIPLLLLATALASGQVPGPSTNMVSGTQWPGGDPFLQRQNEPSMAVSSRNSLHLLAGANDYRSVDIPYATAKEVGDAWLGVFKSFDGGQTWTSTLLPGYPQDTSTVGTSSPLKGRNAAADPLARAGTNGMFYLSGLAFDRSGTTSQIFLSRFIDDNDQEGSDTIRYLGTSIVAAGDTTHFLDKPAIAVDIPRPGSPVCNIPAGTIAPAQSFPAGRIYAAYTSFLGGEGSSTSTIMLTQSNDCGATWSTPKAISGSQQTNQGAALAINPVTGDLYVVWRVFASTTGIDGISGIVEPFATATSSFVSPAARIVSLTPFDQSTTNLSFRTNAYPAIAIDGSGDIYIAWSQRLSVQSDARIMLVSGKVRSSEFDILDLLFPRLTPPAMIDPNTTGGHQIMPALAFSSGKLTAAWYDFRDDGKVAVYTPTTPGQYGFQLTPDGNIVLGQFIADPPIPYASTSRRHTVEVRAAQAPPAVPTRFGPSVVVSQYAFGTPTYGPSSTPGTAIQQLEFDAPNLPMFKQGTVPFFGDYIDVAGPTFVPSGTTWRANTLATDPDNTRVVWTDNRNVIQPADGNWTNYTPVGSTGGQSTYDPLSYRPTCTAGQTGSRNQDIYTAALTTGLVMGAKGNRKQVTTAFQREFPITVQNTTSVQKSYRLSIGAQPAGATASFVQFLPNGAAPVTQLDILIPPLSSASRSVFITSSNPNATVPVSAQEITRPTGSIIPAGLTSSVTLNADVSNPNIANPNIANPNIANPNIANAEVYNPNIANPNIANPNIANPNIANPNIANPNIANLTIANPNIANPNIANPNIANPNIANPNIANPNIANPNIANPNIANTALTDVSYVVTNTGNTAAAYSLQLLQNQAIPSGVVVQTIVSGIYTTPVANGCTLTVEAHYVPIVNVTLPTFATPSNLTGALDPAVPSFALAPGEQVLVTIRVYDSTTSDPQAALRHFNPANALTPVVISVAANTNSPSTPPPLTPAITNPFTLTAGAVGTPYSLQMTAVGGTPPLTWSAAPGSLPNGLNLSSSGLLSGTPTAGGSYSPVITVTDAVGGTTTRTFALTIIQISGLVSGFQGYTYPATILSATGGTPPYIWSGSIAGMNLTPGGVLTGIPTNAGTGTVTVTDSLNNSASATFQIATPGSSVLGSLPSVVNVGNVTLAGGTVFQLTMTPGTQVPVTFNFSLIEGFGYCPGCIDQLTAGFVGTNATSCLYDSTPGPGGSGTLPASLALTAPATPGRYYIAYHKSQQYFCGNALTEGITANDPVIGVVDVIPINVNYQSVSLQSISTTPASVNLTAPPDQITATFNWVSGTLAVGFNTDPAPQACGLLNPGFQSPVYSTPSQTGRYYLSIDNVQNCTGPIHWDHGIPKADFSRFIGVVDVLP